MRKTVISLLAGLFLMVMFTGCGDSNPYIGEWKFAFDESVPFFGQVSKSLPDDIFPTVVFTEDTVMVPLNFKEKNSAKFPMPVSYKKTSDGSWTVCNTDGTGCGIFEFLDKNTIKFGDEGLVLKRM
ncbi:MAG: hypothetical protein LBF40_02750 [Deltaproteobacteria bacterium]|jgi:hypothetical protein|nr:hypothetical protein [Deltaproteobacteria bacterium]